MLRSSTEWREVWDEHTFEVVRMWDAEDFVFVAHREWGERKDQRRPNGERIPPLVYTLSQSRIVSIQIFSSEDQALKAVGLEE